MQKGPKIGEIGACAPKGHAVSEARACTADLGVQFLSESLLALPPGLTLKFLYLEQQLMSYWSVRARGTQCVKRAREADLGAQFLCL